jgi:hypothetical protein
MKASILDEKSPAVHHVVDLFGLMLVRFGVIPRSSGSDHQAALVAVALSHHHRSRSGFPALNAIVFGYILAFHV